LEFIRAARGLRHGHLATYRDKLLEHVAVKAHPTERHSPGRADPPNSHPAAARPDSFCRKNAVPTLMPAHSRPKDGVLPHAYAGSQSLLLG
jgi:hypothetical protein